MDPEQEIRSEPDRPAKSSRRAGIEPLFGALVVGLVIAGAVFLLSSGKGIGGSSSDGDKEVAAAANGYLVALEAGDGASACALMTAPMQAKTIRDFAGVAGEGASCEASVAAYGEVAAENSSQRADPKTAEVSGDKATVAFLSYGNTQRVIELERDPASGTWLVSGIQTTSTE